METVRSGSNLKKRIAHALLCLTLLLGLSLPAHAAEEPVTAQVWVNDVEVEAFRANVYQGTAYVPFYAATLALQPDAQVEWVDGQFVATAPGFTMTARAYDHHLVINGRYLYIADGVKADPDGTVYVPARVLATALGAWIGWDGRVVLYTGGAPLSAEAIPYDETTLDLLARVITHESGYQPLEGKIAVGNVIMNRVNHTSFPDTVYGVVYQRNQFPGATDIAPNTESILAARLVLEGANVVPNALYFNGVGKSCWASRNKSLVAEIGGHAFYG